MSLRVRSGALSILEYYAQACFAAAGSQFPPSMAGLLYNERRPHGVAGLITPWNFPLAIPLWKAAPGLAVGNSMVLKPSSDATGCGVLLGEMFSRHLRDGVFTVVPGGPEAGRRSSGNLTSSRSPVQPLSVGTWP